MNYNRMSAIGTRAKYTVKAAVNTHTVKVAHFECEVSGYAEAGMIECQPSCRSCRLYKRGSKNAMRGRIYKWFVSNTSNGSYEEKTTHYHGDTYEISVTVKKTVSYEAR